MTTLAKAKVYTNYTENNKVRRATFEVCGRTEEELNNRVDNLIKRYTLSRKDFSVREIKRVDK